MAKITPRKDGNTIRVKTAVNPKNIDKPYEWWNAETKEKRATELISTAAYLKQLLLYRNRQASMFARLYGNMPLYNFIGTGFNRYQFNANLPLDRATMNVIQSCIDTKVSRLVQSRPRPLFLTNGGDYQEMNLAQQMNRFILGEFHQIKAYDMGEVLLRDSEVWGSGWWKVVETMDHKVGLERKLLTDILFDPNDAFYGYPRVLYEFKVIDREVALEMVQKNSKSSDNAKAKIERAEQAYIDSSGDSQKTTSDQIMLVEGFRLPSSKDSGDGRHIIACSAGSILDEEFKKERFPYVKLDSSPRMAGMDGQGAAERLMGTQVSINKLLQTMEVSIQLNAVPRVFLETGSKIAKAHINNNVGAQIEYQGTAPIFHDGTSGLTQDVFMHLERLIRFGYQQEGISTLNAGGQKPAGLNSGEAIRSYDDIQTDRFAAQERRYHQAFIDLAYLVIDKAIDIADEQGSYQTVWPNKNGNKQIDLPDIKKLKENPFVIQCMDTSSLPNDPAGRIATITERTQAGIYTPQQAISLMESLDLVQEDQLMTASEKRIRKILDEIVEEGEYTPPDPFMDLNQAQVLVNQYYNLYEQNKLEESKLELLRNFKVQIDALKMAAMPPQQPMPQGMPQAVPEARPVSDIMPQVPTQ